MATEKSYAVKHAFWDGDVYYTRQNESEVAKLSAARIKELLDAGAIADVNGPAPTPETVGEPAKGRNR